MVHVRGVTRRSSAHEQAREESHGAARQCDGSTRGAGQCQRRRDELLAEEKRLTRELDALAARRRRLPMVRVDADYVFEGPDGQQTLLDLFDEHRVLPVYQFMDVGPESFCPGCTYLTDNVRPGTAGGQ
jgi:predicted dithiol-disulfide oxidoreductase (DUF899 family)